MTTGPATPLHIVESYFGMELDRSAIKALDGLSDDNWIDFAKHYKAAMDDNFAGQYLSAPEGGESSLRLFFEPQLAERWSTETRRLYDFTTPLLGHSPHPDPSVEITRDVVSRMLTPLKKHLLVADSVYVRDSFYYCFDYVADSISRTRWRKDPNVVGLVHNSIRSLKAWLPVLVELRGLIESRALVFMPYYLAPGFPYVNIGPQLSDAMARVRMRPRPAPEPTPITFLGQTVIPSVPVADTRIDEEETLRVWLNARILDLDPVFPDRLMFDWASDLYFDDGSPAGELASDLISMDIVPFGGPEGIHLDDLVSMRTNEHVFAEVRNTVLACKDNLEQEFGPDTTRRGLNQACGEFLRDRLNDYERKSVLRFVDKHATVGVAVNIALGAAMIPLASVTGPIPPLLMAALLTPQIGLLTARRYDPRRRAISYLQSLL